MMRQAKRDYSVRTVDIIFDMLELIIAEEAKQVPIQRLSATLDISKDKAFRLLSTLEKRGLVERDPCSGNYQLGVSAIGISQRILNCTCIIKHAHPVMEYLANKHEEAVYMTVMKGNDVLFLDMVDCERTVKAAPLIGQRFPFFSTAAGKVIKALESRDLEKVLKRGRKRSVICDLTALESELDDIRREGVAVDCDGLGDGIVSVAVAVKDYAGKVVGAITMLGPSFRMLAERLENEIIPSLREGAENLSLRLGYAPW